MTRQQRRSIALLSAVCSVFVGAHAARYGWDAQHAAGMTILASQTVMNLLPMGDAR